MAVAPWIVSDELWNRNDVTQLIPLLEAVPAGPRDRHGSGLGRYRWVVERTFAWLRNFKRLLVRLRMTGRDARGAPRTRLLPRLLPTAQELNLK
jgi:transposase